MNVEAFITELRALTPAEAVTRAREATRNPEYRSTLMPHPAFHKWAEEMYAAGHLDNEGAKHD